MSRRVVVLICLLMLAVRAASARQTPKDPFACAPDPYRVVSLVGMVSLGLGGDDVVNKVMPCLLKLWIGPAKMDGDELPGDISNAFLVIMEENSQLFFSIMSKNPQVFKEWLDQLPQNSFTWYFPPPCKLEDARARLISAIRYSDVKGAEPNSLKQQVLERLISIHCRQID